MRQTRKLHLKKRQTGPSNVTRNKRAPFTPQSARRDLLSLQVREKDRDYPLYLFKRWKRAFAREEGWSSSQASNKEVWSSPACRTEKLILYLMLQDDKRCPSNIPLGKSPFGHKEIEETSGGESCPLPHSRQQETETDRAPVTFTRTLPSI